MVLEVPPQAIAYSEMSDVKSTSISSVAGYLYLCCQYGQSNSILWREDLTELQQVILLVSKDRTRLDSIVWRFSLHRCRDTHGLCVQQKNLHPRHFVNHLIDIVLDSFDDIHLLDLYVEKSFESGMLLVRGSAFTIRPLLARSRATFFFGSWCQRDLFNPTKSRHLRLSHARYELQIQQLSEMSFSHYNA